MLRLLRIRNFAIIDSLELELHSGLNAITGETGAGKSIILNAVSLILGNRADADLIRAKSNEATVEALFDIGQNQSLVRKLDAQGFNLSRGDHELLIKRTIHRSGKNKIFVNGELVTLSQLADLCENLVDLCSQHEHQSLSKPAFQLDLLDRYGGLLGARRELRETLAAVRSCEREIRALTGDPHQQVRTEDFLRFQLSEIDEFAPEQGEQEQLNSERRRLLNHSHLIESVNYAVEALSGEEASAASDGHSSARSLLARAGAKLSKAVTLDPTLASAADAIGRASLETDEALAQLESYATSFEFDPARLDAIEQRLAKWNEIQKKYGSNFDEIMATRTQIETELNDFARREEHLSELTQKLDSLKKDYLKAARALSKKRNAVAKTLRNSVQRELAELMMPSTHFEIDFTETEWAADGIDRAQFLFSSNPGEPPKAVAKIASGGELSRVMLAIRRTIADRGGIGVYLFDEIDAGIGGQTATIVGMKLKSVAHYNQVICITHLPQVAAYAEAHYSVTKKVSAGRTSSQIQLLEGSSRVDELARMLGGLSLTDKSRAHAKDLINQAIASAPV